MLTTIRCALFLAWANASLLAADPTIPERVTFNRDVRPILSDNCFFCHGPDRNNRQADLRLDQREAALAAAAFVPGDAQHSELVARILTDDSELVMPPPKSQKHLTDRQKAILKKWVQQGADYEQHWSFVPLTPVPVPTVLHAAWPRNELDRFILARLEQESLPPAPEASKETLIRRVTLDLTGLPPTVAEVDAYLADASPQAYERVVERLLMSPHYGERMAIDWLDAARYADSNGYQVDRDRELWPWRDWVIRAFNDNLSFAQFTIEQLAGDLLPNPTLDQRIATGFHRNHMLNEEGGIIPEEFLAEYTADRVETTAAVWLGQTFTCARCHDHKFDPFTQRDFYSLKAFFHNIPERGVGTYGNSIRQNAPPFVKLPAPEIEAKITRLNLQLKSVNDQLAALTSESSAGLEDWARRLSQTSLDWQPLHIHSASGGDQPPQVDPSGQFVEVGPQETRSNTFTVQIRLPAGRFTTLRIESTAATSSARVQWSEFKVAAVAPVTLHSREVGKSLDIAESAKLLDGDRKTKTVVNLKAEDVAAAIFEFEPPLELQTISEIPFELGVENANGTTRWRAFVSQSDPELLVPGSILEIAKLPAEQRSGEQKQKLAAWRLTQQADHRRLTEEAAGLKKQLDAAEEEIQTTLVMEELPEPRETFVLMRGAYDKPGDAVTAATPAILPPLGTDLPRNRLGLARWLVSPENPLTSRVTVNRLWQQLFGVGLVRTSEDFGAQGEAPSHPELLDWLAQEFIRSGWDVKRFMKLLVTSATYRQQSHLTPAGLARDPENRLLARGPRHRLLGEVVRDQALAASGLLVTKIGGPSVKPYHPAGLYEQVTAGRGYNVYVQGQGDDLHRRSMYTYWKRSVPHPAMLLFDAPFRESCVLRRTRSNTPLQALNLLNDPTYVEASRFLAQRMLREGGDSSEARLIHGFRLLLLRPPRPAELTLLLSALDRAQTDFSNDPAAAKAWLSVGEAGIDSELSSAELAAYTTIASTLLNLDETVTKE